VSYQPQWPLGIALSCAFLEAIACSPTNPPPASKFYGGAAGEGTGAASGSGPGATNGAGPGGAAGGDAGASGAGSSGVAGDGAGGVGGEAGFGGVGGDTGAVGGIGGESGVGGLPPFDGGTEPGRNRVPAGQVCERLATIQCAAEVSCCSSPGRNFDQCKQSQRDKCVNEAHLDAITSNPITNYNIDRAEAAFAEFERLASICDPAIAQWAARTDGLRGILLGTVASGQSCGPPDSDPAIGGARLASCVDGATTACLPVSLFTWTCRPRGPAGADCFSDFNCIDGVYCDNPQLDPTGAKCVQRKPDGAPCGVGNECNSLLCKGGMCIFPNAGAAYCLAAP
jgi:hypothetical protein